MKLPVIPVLALSLAVAAGASAAAGELQRSVALGSSGELYTCLAGTYEALFQDDAVPAPRTPVLALDIARSGQPTQRLLVPGTDDLTGDIERLPSLLYEDSSNTLFLVWESIRNQIHPYLQIISYDGTSWSEPLVIWSNSFALKGSPQLAITRDSYEVADESAPGGSRMTHRAVLHLIWWEEAVGGADVLYAPIILEDGSSPSGAPDIFRLNDLDTAAADGTTAPFELVQAPVVHSGHDHRTVVMGFANHETGRFLTLEVTVLPGELSALAEGIRGEIIDIGESFNPNNVTAFAEDIRGEIIDIGHRLNRQNVTFLAEGIRGEIIDIGYLYTPATIDNLATKIRGEIIDIGSGLFGTEHIRLYDPEEPPIIHESHTDSGTTHLLAFHVASSRLAPSVSTTPTAIFPSQGGEQVLIAWESKDGSRIDYIESQGEGWSDFHSLQLGSSLDRDKALQILEQRANNR